MHFPVFSFTTKYQQRMRRLSCKIFNDFYVPELPLKEFEYGYNHPPIRNWTGKWFSDQRAFERVQEKPFDLNDQKNYYYYPAHPQIRALTHTLREYGLYRDEHRDFNELMKEVARSRGKVPRERRGPNTKGAKAKGK